MKQKLLDYEFRNDEEIAVEVEVNDIETIIAPKDLKKK